MSTDTYQVILSTDGKHTVIATTDDIRSTVKVQLWATTTFEQIVARYGLKGNGKQPEGQPTTVAEIAPVCGVHQVPLVLVSGRRGDFWSCHEKNPDGSWCSWRPESSSETR